LKLPSQTIELRERELAGLNVTLDLLRLATAVGLYATEEVTPGQAAVVAGLNQPQFLHELGRRGISIHYGVSELEEAQAGSSTLTVVCASGSLCTANLPPCSSVRRLEMINPSPAPCCS